MIRNSLLTLCLAFLLASFFPGGEADCYGNAIRLELYFGLGLPGYATSNISAQITEQAWENFLDTVVTPLFPDGLSTQDIPLGQYLNSHGVIAKEQSKLLIILAQLPPDDDPIRKAITIAQNYSATFDQESVLVDYWHIQPYCFYGATGRGKVVVNEHKKFGQKCVTAN